MLCKKCKKDIPDGAPFCCWCGKKQAAEQKRTRRRARGTGSVGRSQHDPSKWRAIAPPIIKGTMGTFLGSAFKTRREAEQAIEAYLNEARPDMYNVTLAKIYEMWSSKHFETLTDSGRCGYTSAYSDIAELHQMKMRDLKTADYQRCIDAVSQKFSRSKCEKVRQLCSQLCKFAMQNDVIDKNYASFLILPKAEKKEKQIFTPDEIAALWEHTQDNRVRLILLMIYTGLRIGEVSQILPENVHISDGYIIGGEKTEAGRDRVIPLPPNIPEISDFVRVWLSAPESAPFGVSKNGLRQYWFYPALSELGIIEPPVYNTKSRKQEYKSPRLTPHSCRHTFASIAAAAGMRPDDLQKIIGHADYSTTADIYVHQNIETLRDAMNVLSK